MAENLEEVAWAQGLFPGARSYLAVHEAFGELPFVLIVLGDDRVIERTVIAGR